MSDPTPALNKFLERYDADNNEWWRVDCGDHLNLFDEAVTRMRELEQTAAFIESREAQLRKMLRRREALTPEATKGYADGLAEAARIVRNRRP
jgi:hypothetical protein